MKTTTSLTKILFVLTIVLLVCMFFDFLALHDIKNDYVSSQVISRFLPNTSIKLPDWTKTEGEWSLVQMSYMIKIVVVGIMFFVLFVLRKRIRSAQ